MVEPTRPLTMVKSGEKVTLVKVTAGRGLVGRLTAMGLVPGVELSVVNDSGRGPFIIAIKDTKIMLGHGMAHRIEVR